MDGVKVVNIYPVRIPAGLASHIDCAAHKEIIIKNIGDIPLKNALHLLGSIVIIGKFPDIINGCGKNFPHSLLNLLLGKPAFAFIVSGRRPKVHSIFASHGVDFLRHSPDST